MSELKKDTVAENTAEVKTKKADDKAAKSTGTGNPVTDDIPKLRIMTCSEAAMFTYAMFLKGRFHLPTEKCCSAYIRLICQRHSRFQCRTCRVFRQKKEI